MFKLDLCNLCGDCLTKCQWTNVDPDKIEASIIARNESRHAAFLDDCITCYACNEVCPQGANPFDRIAELQEKYQIGIAQDMLAGYEANYVFDGQLRKVAKSKRIMTSCVFGKSDSKLIQGEFFDLPIIGGKPYFCWILFSHMGAESIQRKHAAQFVERLAATGAEEVVCFHDDCYSMLARYAPDYGIEVPFRPVHLSQHLVELLREKRDRLKPLGFDIAYQRPCASRHTPEKEHFIDELFELVGVRRVERTYDREQALCCGGTKFLLGKEAPDAEQQKNILDAKKAGARAMVYLCPMCRKTLGSAAAANELPLIFIGDLARMALGEIESPLK